MNPSPQPSSDNNMPSARASTPSVEEGTENSVSNNVLVTTGSVITQALPASTATSSSSSNNNARPAANILPTNQKSAPATATTRTTTGPLKTPTEGKRLIRTIRPIDVRKLQQSGLDRKIAEALSKQKQTKLNKSATMGTKFANNALNSVPSNHIKYMKPVATLSPPATTAPPASYVLNPTTVTCFKPLTLPTSGSQQLVPGASTTAAFPAVTAAPKPLTIKPIIPPKITITGPVEASAESGSQQHMHDLSPELRMKHVKSLLHKKLLQRQTSVTEEGPKLFTHLKPPPNEPEKPPPKSKSCKQILKIPDKTTDAQTPPPAADVRFAKESLIAQKLTTIQQQQTQETAFNKPWGPALSDIPKVSVRTAENASPVLDRHMSATPPVNLKRSISLLPNQWVQEIPYNKLWAPLYDIPNLSMKPCPNSYPNVGKQLPQPNQANVQHYNQHQAMHRGQEIAYNKPWAVPFYDIPASNPYSNADKQLSQTTANNVRNSSNQPTCQRGQELTFSKQHHGPLYNIPVTGYGTVDKPQLAQSSPINVRSNFNQHAPAQRSHQEMSYNKPCGGPLYNIAKVSVKTALTSPYPNEDKPLSPQTPQGNVLRSCDEYGETTPTNKLSTKAVTPQKSPQDIARKLDFQAEEQPPNVTQYAPASSSNLSTLLVHDLLYTKAPSYYSDIPKASIKPVHTPPSLAQGTLAKHRIVIPDVSPLKTPFPTANMPQEAPLPTIDTFKKPYPLPGTNYYHMLPSPPTTIVGPHTGFITTNYHIHPSAATTTTTHSMQSHPAPNEYNVTPVVTINTAMAPNSLIVLENKVLSQDEMIDLTALRLSTSKIDAPQRFARPHKPIPEVVIKQEKPDDFPAAADMQHQSVSKQNMVNKERVQPGKGLVFLSSKQNKKFIVNASKLKLPPEKIADLAKKIAERTGSQALTTDKRNFAAASGEGPGLLNRLTSAEAEKQKETTSLITGSEKDHERVTDANRATGLQTTTTPSFQHCINNEQNVENIEKVAQSHQQIFRNFIGNVAQHERYPNNFGQKFFLIVKKDPQASTKVLPKQLAANIGEQSPMTASHIVKPLQPQGLTKVKQTHQESIMNTSFKYAPNRQSAVEIIDEPEAEDSFSAVDFIASLATSNPITEETQLELSPEELNLNASCAMNLSPLRIPFSPRKRKMSTPNQYHRPQVTTPAAPVHQLYNENSVEIGNIVTLREDNNVVNIDPQNLSMSMETTTPLVDTIVIESSKGRDHVLRKSVESSMPVINMSGCKMKPNKIVNVLDCSNLGLPKPSEVELQNATVTENSKKTTWEESLKNTVCITTSTTYGNEAEKAQDHDEVKAISTNIAVGAGKELDMQNKIKSPKTFSDTRNDLDVTNMSPSQQAGGKVVAEEILQASNKPSENLSVRTIGETRKEFTSQTTDQVEETVPYIMLQNDILNKTVKSPSKLTARKQMTVQSVHTIESVQQNEGHVVDETITKEENKISPSKLTASKQIAVESSTTMELTQQIEGHVVEPSVEEYSSKEAAKEEAINIGTRSPSKLSLVQQMTAASSPSMEPTKQTEVNVVETSDSLEMMSPSKWSASKNKAVETPHPMEQKEGHTVETTVKVLSVTTTGIPKDNSTSLKSILKTISTVDETNNITTVARTNEANMAISNAETEALNPKEDLSKVGELNVTAPAAPSKRISRFKKGKINLVQRNKPSTANSKSAISTPETTSTAAPEQNSSKPNDEQPTTVEKTTASSENTNSIPFTTQISPEIDNTEALQNFNKIEEPASEVILENSEELTAAAKSSSDKSESEIAVNIQPPVPAEDLERSAHDNDLKESDQSLVSSSNCNESESVSKVDVSKTVTEENLSEIADNCEDHTKQPENDNIPLTDTLALQGHNETHTPEPKDADIQEATTINTDTSIGTSQTNISLLIKPPKMPKRKSSSNKSEDNSQGSTIPKEMQRVTVSLVDIVKNAPPEMPATLPQIPFKRKCEETRLKMSSGSDEIKGIRNLLDKIKKPDANEKVCGHDEAPDKSIAEHKQTELELEPGKDSKQDATGNKDTSVVCTDEMPQEEPVTSGNKGTKKDLKCQKSGKTAKGNKESQSEVNVAEVQYSDSTERLNESSEKPIQIPGEIPDLKLPQEPVTSGNKGTKKDLKYQKSSKTAKGNKESQPEVNVAEVQHSDSTERINESNEKSIKIPGEFPDLKMPQREPVTSGKRRTKKDLKFQKSVKTAKGNKESLSEYSDSTERLNESIEKPIQIPGEIPELKMPQEPLTLGNKGTKKDLKYQKSGKTAKGNKEIQSKVNVADSTERLNESREKAIKIPGEIPELKMPQEALTSGNKGTKKDLKYKKSGKTSKGNKESQSAVNVAEVQYADSIERQNESSKKPNEPKTPKNTKDLASVDRNDSTTPPTDEHNKSVDKRRKSEGDFKSIDDDSDKPKCSTEKSSSKNDTISDNSKESFVPSPIRSRRSTRLGLCSVAESKTKTTKSTDKPINTAPSRCPTRHKKLEDNLEAAAPETTKSSKKQRKSLYEHNDLEREERATKDKENQITDKGTGSPLNSAKPTDTDETRQTRFDKVKNMEIETPSITPKSLEGLTSTGDLTAPIKRTRFSSKPFEIECLEQPTSATTDKLTAVDVVVAGKVTRLSSHSLDVEDSCQDSTQGAKISPALNQRKKLRKTLEDIKKSHKLDTDSEDDRNFDAMNGGCEGAGPTDFLGFEDNSLGSAKSQKPEGISGDEKSPTNAATTKGGTLKNWLTTGKAISPTSPKDRTASSKRLRHDKKSFAIRGIPLKKRWDASKKTPEETDITDDTSPADDEDVEDLTHVKRSKRYLKTVIDSNKDLIKTKRLKLKDGGGDTTNHTFAEPKPLVGLRAKVSETDSDTSVCVGRRIKRPRRRLISDDFEEEEGNTKTVELDKDTTREFENPKQSELDVIVGISDSCGQLTSIVMMNSEEPTIKQPSSKANKSKVSKEQEALTDNKETNLSIEDTAEGGENMHLDLKNSPARSAKNRTLVRNPLHKEVEAGQKDSAIKSEDELKGQTQKTKSKEAPKYRLKRKLKFEEAECEKKGVINSEEGQSKEATPKSKPKRAYKRKLKIEDSNGEENTGVVLEDAVKIETTRSSRKNNKLETTKNPRFHLKRTPKIEDSNDLSNCEEPYIPESCGSQPQTPSNSKVNPASAAPPSTGRGSYKRAYTSENLFNHRLLLITKREQLETDEVLTEATPGTGPVQCGLCMKRTTESKWVVHLAEHYGVGWKLGGDELDIQYRPTVLNIIVNYLRDTEITGLICRMCNKLYRSGLGLLTHVESCGAERQRVDCEYCYKNYSITSLPSHLRSCLARLKQSSAKRPEINTEETSFSATGRAKRYSTLKAESKLKQMGAELVKTNEEQQDFKAIDHIRYNPPLGDDARKKWSSDIVQFGKGFCPKKSCSYTSDKIEELEEHITKCKFVTKPGHYCTFCKRRYFETEKEAIEHVNASHGFGKDFSGSDSDCNIKTDDEQSSNDDDDQSEGVDEDEAEAEAEAESDDLESSRKSHSKSPKKKSRSSKATTASKSNILPLILRKRVFERRSREGSNKMVLQKWKSFLKFNYSPETLFDNFKCQYSVLKTQQYLKYLPNQEKSMKFSITKDSRLPSNIGEPQANIEWKEMERFKAINNESDAFLFVGAPVTSCSWLPLPAHVEEQYLLVVYRKDMFKFTKFANPKRFKTSLMLFKVTQSKENGTKRPQLEPHYGVIIEDGPVYNVSFLPSGGYNLPDNRLALVAVASVASSVKVYALPIELSKDCSERNGDDDVPLIEITPSFELNLDVIAKDTTGGHVLLNPQCLQISWSEFSGHNHIFASFSNGCIGIWDVTNDPQENLNRFEVENVLQYVPLNYFYVGEKGIKHFALHYDSSGPRWLAVNCFYRRFVIYDIRNFMLPVILKEDFTRNVVRCMDWCPLWEPVLIAYCDSIPNNGRCVQCINPSSVMYHQQKLDTMNSAVTAVHYTPFSNMCIASVDNGDVLFMDTRELHYEQVVGRKFSERRILSSMDVKQLDEKPIERISKATNGKDETVKIESEWILYDYDYKEKYGLVFHPLIKLNDSLKSAYFSENRRAPLNITPFMRINTLRCNLNKSAKRLVAVGYENGFIRVIYFDKDSQFRNC